MVLLKLNSIKTFLFSVHDLNCQMRNALLNYLAYLHFHFVLKTNDSPLRAETWDQYDPDLVIGESADNEFNQRLRFYISALSNKLPFSITIKIARNDIIIEAGESVDPTLIDPVIVSPFGIEMPSSVLPIDEIHSSADITVQLTQLDSSLIEKIIDIDSSKSSETEYKFKEDTRHYYRKSNDTDVVMEHARIGSTNVDEIKIIYSNMFFQHLKEQCILHTVDYQQYRHCVEQGDAIFKLPGLIFTVNASTDEYQNVAEKTICSLANLYFDVSHAVKLNPRELHHEELIATPARSCQTQYQKVIEARIDECQETIGNQNDITIKAATTPTKPVQGSISEQHSHRRNLSMDSESSDPSLVVVDQTLFDHHDLRDSFSVDQGSISAPGNWGKIDGSKFSDPSLVEVDDTNKVKPYSLGEDHQLVMTDAQKKIKSDGQQKFIDKLKFHLRFKRNFEEINNRRLRDALDEITRLDSKLKEETKMRQMLKVASEATCKKLEIIEKQYVKNNDGHSHVIAQLELEKQQLKESDASLQATNNALKIRIEELEARVQAGLIKIVNFETTIAEKDAELSNRLKDLEKLREKNKGSMANVVRMELERKRLVDIKKQADIDIKRLSSEKLKSEKELKEKEKLIRRFHEEKKKLTSENDSRSERISQLEVEIESLTSSLEEADRFKLQLESQAKKLEEQLDAMSLLYTQSDEEKKQLQKKQSANQEKIQELTRESEALNSSIKILNEEVACAQLKIQAKERSIKEVEDKVKSLIAVRDDLQSQVLSSSERMEEGANNIERLKSIIDAKSKEILSLNQEIISISEVSNKREKVIHDLASKLETSKSNHENGVEEITNLKIEIKNLQSFLAYANQKISSQNQELQSSRSKISGYEIQLGELTRKIESSQLSLDNSKTKLLNSQKDLSKSQLRVKELEESIGIVTLERDELRKKVCDQEKTIQGLEASLSSHESRLTDQHQTIQDLTNRIAKSTDDIVGLEENLKSQSRSYQADKSAMQKKIDDGLRQHTSVQHELQQSNQQVLTLQSELKKLQSALDKFNQKDTLDSSSKLAAMQKMTQIQEKNMQDMLREINQLKATNARLSNGIKQKSSGLKQEIQRVKSSQLSVIDGLKRDKATLSRQLELLKQNNRLYQQQKNQQSQQVMQLLAEKRSLSEQLLQAKRSQQSTALCPISIAKRTPPASSHLLTTRRGESSSDLIQQNRMLTTRFNELEKEKALTSKENRVLNEKVVALEESLSEAKVKLLQLPEITKLKREIEALNQSLINAQDINRQLISERRTLKKASSSAFFGQNPKVLKSVKKTTKREFSQLRISS